MASTLNHYPTSLAVILISVLSGCSRELPTYYEDVKPVLDARCVSCHSDGGIAPFELSTYDSAHSYRSVLANAVGNKRMPPWFAVSEHQTYSNNPSLTLQQAVSIIDWANGGGPEGDPLTSAPSLESITQSLASIDQTIRMSEPFTPTEKPDQYRCFVLDWPTDQATFVTGFDATPGNLEIVHHMAAFLFRPDTLYGEGIFDILSDWDETHDGIGYPCFGGPSGGDDIDLPIQQLAQWVPGMGAINFPLGSGIEVPSGSKIVLQIHYNSESDSPSSDQSSILFSTSDDVETRGAFAPWLDATWPLGTMTIPADDAKVTHTGEGSPFGLFEFLIPDMDLSNGFDIHSILVHMHQLGSTATVAIKRENGSTETLLELERYDFNWQLIYQLKEPVSFEPNDELSVSCTWNNSPSNQPDGRESKEVNWGEGTSDEMCVANLFITERY